MTKGKSEEERVIGTESKRNVGLGRDRHINSLTTQ